MPGEPTWWSQFEKLMDERFNQLDREFANVQKALELQAAEYARRLEDLNHAHARAQDALNTFLREDKYEDNRKADEQARVIALERVDEKMTALHHSLSDKLDDYITKTEARQAEIDQAIANQKGAATEALRATEEQARKTNRNMAILGVIVTVVIAISNWLGSPDPSIVLEPGLLWLGQGLG